MYFYKLYDKLLFSNVKYPNLDQVLEEDIVKCEDVIYFLINSEPSVSRRSYSLSDPSLFYQDKEDVKLLKEKATNTDNFPEWIIKKIQAKSIKLINTGYPKWKDALSINTPSKWRVNVIGLGDVGGTLVTGLRLLGGDCISSIGIYDLDMDKAKRWEYEASQILNSNNMQAFPEVVCIDNEDLFNCDMFVFCVSVGVPSIDKDVKDVRMAQFDGNSRVVNIYAKEARGKDFKGIFAVVSDPVDLLCKSAFLSSNTNSSGEVDFFGLAPEQIKGYGLGVMNARAVYYAKQSSSTIQYLKEGRVFGPHGEGLIVADSIINYNNKLSIELTKCVKHANIEIRKTGYKPYIAPAFSSGALSLINTIKGEWHYSSNFMGGVFMGAKNRLLNSGIEIERLNLDEKLLERLEKSYEELGMIL
ncbi:MAG: lactate dehydrogenase [Clostridiales bacterium]|nr:lactate dehydrogenase [Clostridiales bacterium]